MSVLAAKVDAQTDAINRLVSLFDKHVEQDRVVEIKVDRLEQTEIGRRWHLRAIWGALCAGAISWWMKL